MNMRALKFALTLLLLVLLQSCNQPPSWNANVMHSTVVFAFDAQGQARLLISDLDDSDAVVSDLNQLIDL